MTRGTRSLLWGVHQFALHPFFIWLSWVWLYRSVPTWRETVCIVIHDWGYWGKQFMDDEVGQRHPEWAAAVAGKLFGPAYRDLCLYHSRFYSCRAGVNPSKLCWADKFCICIEPWWFYIPRALLSGELKEYREHFVRIVGMPLQASHRAWYRQLRQLVRRLIQTHAADLKRDVCAKKTGG